jgi:hypothetical protein
LLEEGPPPVLLVSPQSIGDEVVGLGLDEGEVIVRAGTPYGKPNSAQARIF